MVLHKMQILEETEMDAKQHLAKISMYNRDIDRATKKLEEAEARIGSAPAFDYSQERVQTSSHGDSVIKKGINVLQARWELQEARKGRQEIIEGLKEILDTDEYEVVMQVYDIGYSLKSASAVLGWGYARTKRVYASALTIIEHQTNTK